MTTLSEDGPHAIPVSAPVRVAGDILLIALRADRDSLARLTANPSVAITVLAAGDVAFTARGKARRVGEQAAGSAAYVSVAIRVEHVDDHRKSAVKVTSGVEREWQDEADSALLGDVSAPLRELVETRDARRVAVTAADRSRHSQLVACGPSRRRGVDFGASRSS